MNAMVYNSEDLPVGLYQVCSVSPEHRLFTLIKQSRTELADAHQPNHFFLFQTISHTKVNCDELRHTFIRVNDQIEVIEVSGDRQIKHYVNLKYETPSTAITVGLPDKSVSSKIKKTKKT